MNFEKDMQIIDRDDVEMEQEVDNTNNISKQGMIESIMNYIDTNKKKSTFEGWIAHTERESIRINPRLRYEDSSHRNAWNNTINIEGSTWRKGYKVYGLPESSAIIGSSEHATCGWPKTPLTIVASAKKINRRKSRKGKKPKKPKKRKTKKTRRGRK